MTVISITMHFLDCTIASRVTIQYLTEFGIQHSTNHDFFPATYFVLGNNGTHVSAIHYWVVLSTIDSCQTAWKQINFFTYQKN